ncbi:hypothetical protein NHX12_007488 [Muraenolepis orangiensis]|uniref:Uncharacterized protein n=1 Tax=Muraenolepis orangiensis TaxID=630683 RepID=A0A9Q0ID25_9TELE|nr:hypothetical protein NHX12_007488 [Muraenolepis orangiensis]
MQGQPGRDGRNPSAVCGDGASVTEEEGSGNIFQAQEPNGQLSGLMQSTSVERDSLREKVTELLKQLTHTEARLRADKSMFQQAREKAEALSREKEALLQQNQEKAKQIEEALLQQNQEKAKQIEHLVCSLDQSRADMVKLFEDKSLFQQAREKAEALSREKDALLQQNQEKAKKIEEALLQQNQEKAKQIEDLVCSLDQSRADMVKLCVDKRMFHQAKEKAEALSREKEALLQQNQEKAKQIEDALLQQNQEKAKQIEDLLCSLDQSRADMVKLQIKVNRLEEDASLSAEREQIRLREEQEAIRERHSSTQTTTGEAGDSAETSMATSGGTNRRLVELRHNVARLLLRYVPLELDQVNYECNVIDEILEQFLGKNNSAPHHKH